MIIFDSSIVSRFKPKFKWVQKLIDLLDYESAIINGVKAIDPEAIVFVYKDYFEVIGVVLSDKQRREMGSEIIARDHRLNNFVVEYYYNDGLDISRQFLVAC